MSSIVSLGFREALGLTAPAEAEKHQASRLLARISDRRVLHELYGRETPLYCRRSIDIIRDRLTQLRADARDFPALDDHIASLLAACQAFMDEAGPMESEFRVEDEPERVDMDRFVAALAGLRKAFGLHVMHIAEAYGLQPSAELMPMIPADEG